MVETLIIGGVIFILAGASGVVLGLRIQRHFLESIRKQQSAWERAEEARRQIWEQRQQREMAALKQSVATQIEQLRGAYEERITQAVNQLGVELELARLPRVDETPILSRAAEEGTGMPAHWRPASLHKADLSHRDLSHRYLGRADLRGARLVSTNLSMADLSRACLAGADLTRANLTGANLAYADLRNANLSEATLLVADLHHTNLSGANLRNVYSLTSEQLRSAIREERDSSSQEVEETSPRMPAVRPARIIPERPAVGNNASRSKPQQGKALSEVSQANGRQAVHTQEGPSEETSASLTPPPEGASASSITISEQLTRAPESEPDSSPAMAPTLPAALVEPEPSPPEIELGQSEQQDSSEDYFSAESLAYLLEGRREDEQPEIPAWLQALGGTSATPAFDFAPGIQPSQSDLQGQHADREEFSTGSYGGSLEGTTEHYEQEEFPTSASESWSASTWENLWRAAAERTATFQDEGLPEREYMDEQGAGSESVEPSAERITPFQAEAARQATGLEEESTLTSEPGPPEAFPQVPETPFAVPTLDTLPFIERLVDPLPPAPQAGSESLLDPQVTDHIVDTQELQALKRKTPAPKEQPS